MTIDVTLLLCTRDRAASLGNTLASISDAARRVRAAIEVIVVDNGSSDDTPARLAAWASAQSFAVRILHEPQAGLARARNRGLAQASGAIIAMTDDDCVLHAGYFGALAAAFALYPAPAIIGGRILPGDPADLPVTIKLEDHPMLLDADAFPGGFVMGANLAFTRDVLALVGAFDDRFGAGARFVAAEDTDFLFRARAHGIPVAYDPCFVVDHHHGRRREDAVVALLAGYGYGDGALYAKHIGDRRIVRAIGQDLHDVWTGWRSGARPFPFIRSFHLFRLRWKVRGLLAYAGSALRSRATSRQPMSRRQKPSAKSSASTPR